LHSTKIATKGELTTAGNKKPPNIIKTCNFSSQVAKHFYFGSQNYAYRYIIVHAKYNFKKQNYLLSLYLK